MTNEERLQEVLAKRMAERRSHDGTCATCHYMRPYLTNTPSEGGECMYHAPVAAVVRDIVVTIRPHVMESHYCGEWTAKESH